MTAVVGTVLRWDDQKGFGFIMAEGVEKDVFVHYSAIDGDGRKSLAVGQSVTIEIESTDRGLRASSCRPIDG